MARLERIHYQPMRFDRITSDDLPWVADDTRPSISDLPQIYFSDGEPWVEVNSYALDRVEMGKSIKTVVSDMGHLRAYADWLEDEDLDWRYFPKKKARRCVFRFRGHLVGQREEGDLSPSTASARMNAVERFYRWAKKEDLLEQGRLWDDHTVTVSMTTEVGLRRSFPVEKSELSIPNRKRHGDGLEGGLLPVSEESSRTLLEFLRGEGMVELYLMFLIGFTTGARSETIRTLRTSTLDIARPDPSDPNLMRVPVGPPTPVKTKQGVSGEILFPLGLIRQLEKYRTSIRRLERESKAAVEDKSLLFLTRVGREYTDNSFTDQMSKLKKRLRAAGHKHYDRLKFHQSRASFGTWTVSRMLDQGHNPKTILEFVRMAMLHKDTKTTWEYITFVQHSPMKEDLSTRFFDFFSGQDSQFDAGSVFND
ncbi:site-specific integrase [Guyparkeria sp. SCN-R1]|uniref:tyrosine-type recombinase/integrase n=1 Tax=Guyparkeria sp. SCN-R1 TaxID=2341113 RepID=UPI001315A87E|nr:site-specific integrase [Guyparkeria sp. SCN-R1]